MLKPLLLPLTIPHWQTEKPQKKSRMEEELSISEFWVLPPEWKQSKSVEQSYTDLPFIQWLLAFQFVKVLVQYLRHWLGGVVLAGPVYKLPQKHR